MLGWRTMPGLGSIIGQERAVEILRAAVASQKVHHGYLFDGPAGVGKAACARALAMALNCEARDPLGCGACEACRKIEAGHHPDVIAFDMTPKGLTERVRELQALCGFRPHEGRARVVIFDPAGDLAGPQERAEPANVLLKTLEEPPEGTYFLLVTAEAKRLPVTVRSRCQRLRFAPLGDQALEQLRARSDDGDDQAVSESRGALVETMVTAARKGDGRAIFAAASEAGGDRAEAEGACALLAVLLRDALLVRESLHRGRVPAERADRAAQLLGDRTPGQLLAALAAAREASLALRGNVAPSLALERLMLRLAPRAPSRNA
ncbi:MAG TPA: AAA family ATPase [Polyangia bacterium]|jgi:DNA polymerase-3 subunit delta'